MKKGILLFLSLFFAFVMSAQERTENDAASIARSFFNGATKRNTAEKQSELRLVAVSSTLLPTLSTRSSSYPAFYVFNNGENGYVIVSGDERMKTILGYSKNSSFITDSVSSSTLAWLEMYINEMNQLAQIENTFPFAEFDNEVRNYPTAISPLLGNVQWNQGAPYNNKCPQKSVTGCVATAMAMVMNYHQYPGKGKGSKSYKTATLGININYDFSNVTFDWSKMLPEYVSGSYSPEQANAVAELMYACGIAVEMDYNPSGSGAFSQQIPQAMIDYFGYDENATYYTRDCFSYNDWVSMIKEEIAEGRPILYNGTSKEGGHQFIFDGYDESNLVHINWGWGGSNNGYFEISSLEPSNPGIGGGTNLGGGFTYSQGMIVGIQKPTNTSQYQASFTVQHITFDQFPAKKGDEVAPKIVSLYNQGTYIEAGQVSLILEKDGLQREVGIASFSKLSTGYGFPSIDWQAQLGSIPFPDVPDGTYLFYVGVRVPSKDNKWFKALCSMGYDGMYHVVVEGDKVTFLPTWTTPSLAASIVEVYHGLYSGQVADFRVAFANNSNVNEYYGVGAVGLFQNNVLKTTIGTSTLFLQPNEIDKVVDYSEILPDISSGEYDACPIVSWGSKLMKAPGVKVTVKEMTGTSDITLSSMTINNKECPADLPIDLSAVFTLSGSVYSKTLAVAIFNTLGENVGQFYQNVFYENEGSKEFSMKVNHGLSEGHYQLGLFKPVGNSYQQMGAVKPFTIVTPTGIEAVSSNQTDIHIYLANNSNIIVINSNIALQSATIYSASGQMLLYTPLPSDHGEHLIEVHDLPSGSYILTLHSDNSIFTQKFMKQ